MGVENPLQIEPTVEFAILADAVQASQGKLFILGGGWDTLFVGSFPAQHHALGIALRLRVPWAAAGTKLSLTIDLEDEDGASILSEKKLRHDFVTRQPRGVPEGSDLGIVRAFTFNNVPLPSPGSYSFVISVDGQELHRLRFFARSRQGPSTAT